jgi:hypothetical protein
LLWEYIMPDPRLILDYRDAHHRPTRRTLADGLMRLEQELGERPDARRCHLRVPGALDGTAFFAALWYRSDNGDDVIVAYPSSKGCRARMASRTSVYLSLDQLDGALLDENGSVLLRDGRSVQALEFDVLPHPRDFTDLEHAIVFLTVRSLNAEDIGFRCIPEAGHWWIDYSRLPELSVQNVKELARYIDAHIGGLPRGAGKPALGPVSLDKIQNTLAMAGIQKVRGRKRKRAA